MVSFAEPLHLWFLAAPAMLLLLVIWRHRRRLRLQKRLASPAVWRRLMGGAPATGLARMVAWCIAAAAIALALARPQWGEIPDEVSVRTRDLVLAIDVSDSMRCPDVRPDRLSWAMEIIHRTLPALEGNRVGVVVFAGDAYPLIPLTIDLQAAASFLDGVTPGMVGLPGSNIEAAVDAAVKLLPAEGDGRVVALLTDGENLQGSPEVAAKTLSDAGASLLGVVVGTRRGGPIPERDESGAVHYKRTKEGQAVVTRADPQVLRSMTDHVSGEVLLTDAPDPEKRLVEAVEGLRTREIETRTTPRKVERFPVFLALGCVALAVGFALSPWRRMAVAALLVLVPSGVAMAQQPAAPPQGPAASSPPTRGASSGTQLEGEGAVQIPWWQRLIPGGSRRLAREGHGQWRKEEVEQSIESFAGAAALAPEDPTRLYDLGTALAGAGAGEQAVPILEVAERGGVDGAAFNAGTAALTAGQAEVAVEALRRALLANPDDPAVKRNYELALKLLEQQQQEQQDQQDQEQQDEEQQEQENQDEEQQDQQQNQEQQPTPTPTPTGEQQQQQPQPTPTPDPNGGIYAALDRAEAEARDDMRKPTPQPVTVEKDW